MHKFTIVYFVTNGIQKKFIREDMSGLSVHDAISRAKRVTEYHKKNHLWQDCRVTITAGRQEIRIAA